MTSEQHSAAEVLADRVREIIRTSRDDHDLKFLIGTVAEYCEYVASRIEPEKNSADISDELLTAFEAISLLLLDLIGEFPSAVQKQVEAILRDEKLPQRIAEVAAVPSSRRTARQPRGVMKLLYVPLYILTLGEALDGAAGRRADLFALRTALNRLAQILRYASSLDVIQADIQVDDHLRPYYDPTLIDKTKLAALLVILRRQVEGLPDTRVRANLLATVSGMEVELRHRKPKWGTIIAAAFVLFSAVADLKSLSPTTYDAVYRTVHAVITLLHEEASVAQHGRKPLLPMDGHDVAILPAPGLERKEDNDADEQDRDA